MPSDREIFVKEINKNVKNRASVQSVQELLGNLADLLFIQFSMNQ